MAVLCLSNCKKTWYYLKKNGIKAAWLAALERLLESRGEPYEYIAPLPEELDRQRVCRESDIRISVVVPAFETKEAHLTELLSSLWEQTYPHWELVVADAGTGSGLQETLTRWSLEHQAMLVTGEEDRDVWQDRRIRWRRLSRNEGIAGNTNAGIMLAAGDYIGLLDHDDLLTPDALFEMATAAEKEKKDGKQPLVLYSDEDKCDGTASCFYEPYRKPDFDPALLLSNNYICHFLVMDGRLLKKLKLRSGFDGAQDYDLVLRAAAEGISFVHVPKILYHWRCHDGSTAVNPGSKAYAYEAGKRAVEEYCRKAGWKVRVSHLKHLGFYRVDYEGDLFSQRPDIGIVAGPVPDGKAFCSGIYEADGSMRFSGLKKGFSGPMHRAALQQEVQTADLRNMAVCPGFEPLYKRITDRILEKGAREEEIRRESADFCERVRGAGYRILWDPHYFGERAFENNDHHSKL